MNNYIKIFSHPRSGTHFLEAFLAKNFYDGDDLSSNGPIYFGHWSNKILLEGGEPYHKLFGSHFFPEDSKFTNKMIYKDWEGLSFSEFLRKDIDWYGGLGQKKQTKMNIVEHWFQHTDTWLNVVNNNLLFIRFEDLKEHPDKIYLDICRKFYPKKFLKAKEKGIKIKIY